MSNVDLRRSLPVYIDNFKPVADFAALPAVGDTELLYRTLNDERIYAYVSGVGYVDAGKVWGTDRVPEHPGFRYFTEARVLATPLTGLSTATPTVIGSVDSVLVALGKLQAQHTAHVGSGGATHALATTTVAGFMSAAQVVKLNGIATGATANQTDAWLVARANHTGTQAIATVAGLQTALDSKEPNLGFTPIQQGTATGQDPTKTVRIGHITDSGKLGLQVDATNHANVWPISITDNAGTATTLQTARTIGITGDGTWTATFNGSANVTSTFTLANTGVAAGTYTKLTVDAKGRVTAAAALVASDIPSLDWSKITSGKPTTLAGYGITDAALATHNHTIDSLSNVVLTTPLDGQLLTKLGANWVNTAQSALVVGSAAKLNTARTFTSTGDVAWSVSFDGTGNVTGAAVLANTGVTAGTYTKVIVNSKGLVTGTATLLASDIPTLNQNTTGNAATATVLQTTRSISATGDGTWSVNFNGGANATAGFTLANTGVVAGEYTKVTVDAKGRVLLGTTLSPSDVPTLNQNTTGNAATATALETGRALTIGSTAKTFDGTAALSWSLTEIGAPSVTGVGASGTWGISVTGNAATVTNGVYTTGAYADPTWITSLAISKLAGTLPVTKGGTGVGTLTGLVKGNGTSAFSAAVAGTDYVAPSGSITGNAGTATTLQTARTIAMTGDGTWSVSFNGGANVAASMTLAASGVTAGTYTKITVDSKGRATGGTTLSATDIPVLDWSKITTGKPTTRDGYGITDVPLVNGTGATGTWAIDISGNAATVTALATARSIGITGDLTWSTTFDGTANVTAVGTLANSGVTAATYGGVVTVTTFTVDSKGRITAASNTAIRAASTTLPGIVQLNNTLTSTSTTEALTAAQGKNLRDFTPVAERISGTMNTTAGTWVRIAKSPLDIDRCTGEFYIRWSISSNHGVVRFNSSMYYAQDPTIIQTEFSRYGGGGFDQIRVVFNLTHTGNYAYLELRASGTHTGLNVDIQLQNGFKWILEPLGTAGSIPAGYTAYEKNIYLKNTAGTFPKVQIDDNGRVLAGSALSATDIPSLDWSKITSGKPTTLAGYGITDAVSTTGNAASATKLQTSRSLTATGDGSWSVNFDGTVNATAAFTLASTGIAAGTYTKITVDSKGRATAGAALVASDIPSLDWSKITSGKPTTLAGYGITDAALASHNHTLDSLTNVTVTSPQDSQVLLYSSGVWVNASQSGVVSGSATKLATPRSITATGDASWTVTFDGSANVTAGLTLANSGVIAGTYGKVTVNAKGLVTAGTALVASDIPSLDWSKITSGKPTTLAGYGITDAVSSTGNAASATKLQTARTISATGDGTWSVSFDGTANTSAAFTLANSGVIAGTYGKVTVDTKGRVTVGSALAVSDIPLLDLTQMPEAAVKKSVRVATTANITLSGPQTIDGIAVVAGDRVLVKDQTTTSQNGIYIVNASTWVRATDADAATKIAGAFVNVDSGAVNGGLRFDTDFKVTDTLATTAMLWYRVVDTGMASSIVGSTHGTAAIGTSLLYARADHVHPVQTSVSGNAGTATEVVRTVAGTGSVNLVSASMGDTDSFRIRVGATASNAGWVELATADDGNEPIYVRQYTGAFSTVTRTATLLDASGNTSFPGTLTAASFLGNATSADSLAAVFNTTNTTNTAQNQWTKIATVTIAVQYHDLAITLYLKSLGNGATTDHYDKLMFRVKQQAVFGSNPFVDVIPNVFGSVAANYGYVIVQNTPSTIVELYVKNLWGWNKIRGVELARASAGGSISYHSDQPYAVTVAGLVEVAPRVLLSDVYLKNTATGLEVGNTSKASHTVIRALSNDSYNAGFEAYGASQGTGYVYVGQDAGYGGGMFYNGNADPAFATGESSDRISFYRRNNTTPEVVFSYGITSNDVTFRGQITATQFNGPLSGNSTTATTLQTTRSISATGDATWSVNFNGSANATAALTLANSGVVAGTYTSTTVDAKGRVTGGTNPTTLTGYGITDAVDLEGTQTLTGLKIQRAGLQWGQMSFPHYAWSIAWEAESSWRALIDVTLQDTSYSAIAWRFKVVDPQNNFGAQTASQSARTYNYYISLVRANATTLGSPDVAYVYGPGTLMRVVKTAVGTYQIQVYNPSQNLRMHVYAEYIAANGNHTIAYGSGAAVGAGTGTIYTAVRGSSREYFEHLSANVLISEVTTGTAPLTIASTTLVTNLNADLLDGQQGSYYLSASNLNAGTVPVARLPAATTSVAGISQLNDTVTSTSTTQAGTANAVRKVYDESGRAWRFTSSTVNTVVDGWYRIATSFLDTTQFDGSVTIRWAMSNFHGVVRLDYSCYYGQNPRVKMTDLSKYGNGGFIQARLVYHPTWSGSYAYLDIKAESAHTNLTVSLEFTQYNRLASIGLTTAPALGSGYLTVLEDLTFENLDTGGGGGGETYELITASQTAEAGTVYGVDARTGAIRLTLPASPAVNDHVAFFDAFGMFDAHNLTVLRNGNLIMSLSDDLIVSRVGTSGRLVFVGGTIGWNIVGGAPRDAGDVDDTRVGITPKLIPSGSVLPLNVYLLPDNGSISPVYTLPSTPFDGARVEWMASETLFSTRPMTIQTSDKPIEGSFDSVTVSEDGVCGGFYYSAGSDEWRAYITGYMTGASSQVSAGIVGEANYPKIATNTTLTRIAVRSTAVVKTNTASVTVNIDNATFVDNDQIIVYKTYTANRLTFTTTSGTFVMPDGTTDATPYIEGMPGEIKLFKDGSNWLLLP